MPAIDQTGMRRLNTGATLRALAAAEGLSTTAELVERTRLSRRTIELILADLIADGWVREVEPPERGGGAGRPRKYYAMCSDRALVAAVVLTPPRAVVVVVDAYGEPLAELSTSIDDDPSRAIAAAAGLVDEAMRASGRPFERLVAVSVGIGGTVSSDGVVLTSPVGDAWPGVDVAAPFRARFGVPVVVENDTNLIALAAQTTGVAADAPTFVLLTPGNRVSAGVVIDGELYRGFQGAAGELVRIPDLGRAWQEHPVAMISSPDEERRAGARDVIRRAAAGEPEAAALADEFFDAVGRLIAVIGWVLAPPVVVLSGGFEGIEEAAASLLARRMAGIDAPDVDIRVAAVGADAALRGAVRRGLAEADAEIYTLRR